VTIADLGLFSGAPQHENFCRVKDLLDTREMTSSSRPYTWAQGDTDTAALVVLSFEVAGAEITAPASA
jgi:hypothetical protein